MCTYVDKKATEAYKKLLRNKKNGKGHAWKLVRVKNGRYAGAFQKYHYYNRLSENFLSQIQSIFERNCDSVPEIRDIIGRGAFHCCLTRKDARSIRDNGTDMKSCRVVKVIFDVADVVAIGKNHADDCKWWMLDPKKNGAVCVTKFKFADYRS